MVTTHRFAAGLAAFGLILPTACTSSGPDGCNCPLAGPGSATIGLACRSGPPVVEITGPCTSTQTSPDKINVVSDTTGTCSVRLTFTNGATASAQIAFTAFTLPCGSDPSGCGETFSATPSSLSLGVECLDSGAGGGPPDR
jgi:hypothetical protein